MPCAPSATPPDDSRRDDENDGWAPERAADIDGTEAAVNARRLPIDWRRVGWLLGPPLTLAVLTLLAVGIGNQALFLQLQAFTQHLPDWFWSWITLLGQGSIVFALIALFWRRHPEWMLAAFCAAPLAAVMSRVFKNAWEYPRPAAILGDQIHVIGDRLLAKSFPSGHSIAAFAVAAVIVADARVSPSTRLLVIALAALVALSRVATGAHWPLDVLAGGMLGWACGLLAATVVARWKLTPSLRVEQLFALIVLVSSASLFVLDLGYPLALVPQYLAGAAGCVAAAYRLFRR
jgi:membrane-associated phospholipid phosphatase